MSTAVTFPTARRSPVPTARRSATGQSARRSATGQSPSTRGWRLTRRGRVVLGVLVSVPFAALLVVNGSVTADAGTSASEQGAATAVVVVQPGESLWKIAQAVAPQADPRATITAIRDLNGLGGNAVVPGQALIVPAA